ncbi:unnamed protein product, partial [Vitis vinifera]
MRSVNNSVETINAAATAIVSAESRVQPTTVQKRRWGSCLSLYWCFGSHRHSKRIGHAVLVPEPMVPGAVAPASENLNLSTSIVLPFIAPPSSPASFLQSDPPSSTQSPAGFLSLTALSAPKLLGFEHFSTRRWGSRLGSGSLTPDGAGPASRDSFLLENQISEVASLANSESGSQNGETVIDHRVSFELAGEDVAVCVEKKPSTENCCEFCVGEALKAASEKASAEGEEEQCHKKHPPIRHGSIKEFNFDNTKGEVSAKPNIIGSEWWVNEKVVGKGTGPQTNWTFFPLLQPGIS